MDSDGSFDGEANTSGTVVLIVRSLDKMARRWKGRNFRNKAEFRSSKSSASTGSTLNGETAAMDTTALWLHWTTRRDVLRYLVHFRNACIAHYHETTTIQRGSSTSSSRQWWSSWLVSEPSPPQVQNGRRLSVFTTVATSFGWTNPFMAHAKHVSGAPEEEYYLIGGVVLPPLTDAVCRQRYLALPRVLSSKQRRLIHSCCVEVDLFHETYSEDTADSPHQRVLVISCYADGFDTIPQIQRTKQQQPPAPLHHYRPWFCRRDPCSLTEYPMVQANDATPTKSNSQQGISKIVTPSPPTTSPTPSNHVQTAQARAVTAIFRLIDQPGRCLRDGHDVLVYEDRRTASLADIVPPSSEKGQAPASDWLLVDTANKMQRCVQELTDASPTELAIDVEAYNVSKYTQLTCLLQLATNTGKVYVIDTLAPGVWDGVSGLAPLLADPAIVKVGHSIGGVDVRCLHRDFGCFLVNVFDTYEASKLLGLESQGLAAVCAHYGLRESQVYSELKAKYQACDWRVRPLTEPMIRYARYDVHYLLRLRWLLMRDLIQADEALWQATTVSDNDGARHFDLEFDDLERDDDDDAARAPLATPVAKCRNDVLDFLSSDTPLLRSDYDDDAATFKTPRQRSKSDDDMFLTPSSSIRNMSVRDDDEADANKNVNDVIITRFRAEEMTAAQLRLQPLLMSCLSVSQERCRDLWSSKSEPYLTNELFVALVKRAKRGEVEWTASNTELYSALFQWRSAVAEEVECLPGFVASLDFLVAVAWKRPTTESGLRRISYQLPAVLEDSDEYVSQLLDLVLRKTMQDGISIATGTVHYYCNLHGREQYEITAQLPQRGSIDRATVEGLAFKLCIAGTIGFGIVAAIMDARRQGRR
jgi:3'-5' exonuclease/HRDC domain